MDPYAVRSANRSIWTAYKSMPYLDPYAVCPTANVPSYIILCVQAAYVFDHKCSSRRGHLTPPPVNTTIPSAGPRRPDPPDSQTWLIPAIGVSHANWVATTLMPTLHNHCPRQCWRQETNTSSKVYYLWYVLTNSIHSHKFMNCSYCVRKLVSILVSW